MSNSSLWRIDRFAIRCYTTQDQSGTRDNGNEGVLRIPQTSVLLEPHYEIIYFYIQDTRCDVVGVFYSLGWQGEIYA